MVSDPDRRDRSFTGEGFARQRPWSEKELRAMIRHEVTIDMDNRTKKFHATVGALVLEGPVAFEEVGQEVKAKVDYTDIAAFLYQNLGAGTKIRVTVQQVENNGKTTH